MWGGRFSAGPDTVMAQINPSIAFDQKLYRQDIAGSKAHAAMLHAVGLLSSEDAAAIDQGLDTIASEIEVGTFVFSVDLEDIHMNIENRLRALIGAAAGRLHTARSRNDQVALDMRLWVKERCAVTVSTLRGLMAELVTKADAHTATVMPGFTHLQTAQPVTFGHHCLAYVEMFARDCSRFEDAPSGHSSMRLAA
ncbi:MAG: lyase family protein, partial [Pseudomonadota bacterium]